MSQIDALYQKVAADGVLQAKFLEILKNAKIAESSETENMLVSFANDAGFSVSIEEAREYFSRLQKQGSDESEMTSAELDLVAGGKVTPGEDAVLLSIFSGGIGCLLTSVISLFANDSLSSCDRCYEQ